MEFILGFIFLVIIGCPLYDRFLDFIYDGDWQDPF